LLYLRAPVPSFTSLSPSFRLKIFLALSWQIYPARATVYVHAASETHNAKPYCSANTRTNPDCLITQHKLVPHTSETLYFFMLVYLMALLVGHTTDL